MYYMNFARLSKKYIQHNNTENNNENNNELSNNIYENNEINNEINNSNYFNKIILNQNNIKIKTEKYEFQVITTRCGRRKSHVTWLESGDASRRIPPLPESNQIDLVKDLLNQFL